jgi:hypothetical protein
MDAAASVEVEAQGGPGGQEVRGRSRSPSWSWLCQRPLWTVTVLFVVSRLAFFGAGVRFDLSPLLARRFTTMQLLSTGLLKHHLVSSVWDLNSQPPLFNLYSGLLLKLPSGGREPVAVVTFAALGLVLVLCTYAAMVELHVPTWLALLVTALIIVDPAFVLYENWLSYGYPTAALVTFGVLALARYVRTGNRLWGLGFFAAAALVVLLDSSFQYLWLAAVVAAVVVGLRGGRRTVVLVALVPVALVAGWAVKDAVQFGTITTSSWLGMNLAKTTISAAGPTRVDALVRSHVLTPFAEVPTFGGVRVYVPHWVRPSHTGSAALDQSVRSDGSPNFNNLAYVAAAKKYLHEDLAFIRADPGFYTATVAKSAALATVPPDEYSFLAGNRSHIGGWARLYDATVMVQPGDDPNPAGPALYFGKGPSPSQVSYTTLLALGLTIVGSPFLIWRWRRRDRGSAVTLTFLWLTVVYLLATTSLIEFGENNRYTMSVGPLPVIAGAAVVTAVVRALFGHPPSPAPPSPRPGGALGEAPQPTTAEDVPSILVP